MHQRLINILKTITYPGLDPDAEAIPRLAADLSKEMAIFVYKQHQPVLWVTILGGTGTGKSTLFNALCGQPISQTGMERLDLSPMEAAVAVFNRSVLANLAPREEDSPLNKALRRPDIVLAYEEIRDRT